MSLDPKNLENSQEQYEEFDSACVRGKNRMQYDYRHTDGDLFSCIAPSLEAAQALRNTWVARKATVPSYFVWWNPVMELWQYDVRTVHHNEE